MKKGGENIISMIYKLLDKNYFNINRHELARLNFKKSFIYIIQSLSSSHVIFQTDLHYEWKIIAFNRMNCVALHVFILIDSPVVWLVFPFLPQQNCLSLYKLSQFFWLAKAIASSVN